MLCPKHPRRGGLQRPSDPPAEPSSLGSPLPIPQIILLSNPDILFLNEFFEALTVLGHLLKLKRGMGLVLGAHFLHTFPVKMFVI